ncbi:hypothetical protein GCM10010430_02650 [Kitasatospora cystarginea]|uniref:Uncharacterized protein n=1 Tax=Kitasatospora cystarginea TaxID=58350 RepID=A0ABN3DBP9_9ACTN
MNQRKPSTAVFMGIGLVFYCVAIPAVFNSTEGSTRTLALVAITAVFVIGEVLGLAKATRGRARR